MFISDLSPSDPADGEAISQGADRIRDVVEALQTSFAVEHQLEGEHKFPSGTTAARPAAGHAGRIYLNTEETILERDTGSAWQLLSAVWKNVAYSTTPVVATPATWTTIQTVNLDVPAGSYGALILAAWAGAASGTQNVQHRIRSDASSVLNPGTITFFAGASEYRFFPAYTVALATGTRTITIELNPASVQITTTFSWMLALVF